MASWWRRNATVRLQTTLVAVFVTGAALFLGAFLVLRAVRGDIRARVQRQVEDVARQVARQVSSGLAPQGFVFASAEGDGGFVPPSVLVTDLETGAVVAQIEPGVAVEDPATNGSARRTFVTGVDPPGLHRAPRESGSKITRSLVVDSPYGRFRVVAASPSEIVSKNTAALQNSLAAGFPALAVLVGVVTWLLTGRSLRPVEHIRAQVEEISERTLHNRVPAPETEDEIGRLAHTMNRMLDRLESSARRQREFVSDASHELRSPVAAIRTELEVALKEATMADWESVATDALAENERLERLVDDLLTLARLDEGRIPSAKEVDLDDLVREETARLRDPRIATTLRPLRTRGNRDQIARAIRNLLENAVRYARARIAIEISASDGTAMIAVSDDGPGIPPEDRERIFERFTRIDEDRARSHGGAGLGLALVRAIAEAHGGTAQAVENGAGARMVLSLPKV